MKGWANQSTEKNVLKMREWIREVSDIYGLTFPTLKIIASAGAGLYSPQLNQIMMAHPSMVTLFHEFRHAMQFQNKAPEYRNDVGWEQRGGLEDDARAWSLSLYRKIAPKTFKKLVTQNRIFFVSVEDL